MSGLFAPVLAATVSGICRGFAAAIGVIALFGLSIFVHEGGHFLAAKLLGLRADVFSIGFGPALWKCKRGGTEYRLSAFPFGGYVALPQLDPAGMASIQGGGGAGNDAPPPAAWWKRLIVAVAGPACNIVLAVPLAFLVWALPPVENQALSFGGAVIGGVGRGSAAEAAGLRAGDMVLQVADRPVGSWSDLVQEIHLCSEDGFATLSVSNIIDGEVRTATAETKRDKIGTWRVEGIAPAETCGVGKVLPGSQAEAAGLREGDTILSVGGVRGVSPATFGRLIAVKEVLSHSPMPKLQVLRGREIADFWLDSSVHLVEDYSAEAPEFALGVRVLSTVDGMPAAEAGLSRGALIASVNGQEVSTAAEARDAIRASGVAPIRLVLFGPDGFFEKEIVPVMHDAEDGEGERPMLGVSLGGIPRSNPDSTWIQSLVSRGIVPASVQAYVPPWSRYRSPADQLKGDALSIWRIFGPIFGHRHKGELGRIATSLGGPVIILSSLWSWLLTSFAAAMGFMRFLNVNLAIVNLLPIPVLDGGHVVFALWRGIFGREIPPKLLNALVNAFGVVIIALFVLLSGCDAMRIWSRFSAQ